MAQDHFYAQCQNCGGPLAITALRCENCAVELHGTIELPRLALLSPEDREFIELFVLSAGSLKKVGQTLGLSYPTVRTRLDKVIATLQNLAQNNQAKRLEIIRALENHEITVEEATKKLNILR